MIGFKPVPVFDVAQTAGEELPQAPLIVMAHAAGDAPAGMVADLLGAIGALGYRVEFLDQLIRGRIGGVRTPDVAAGMQALLIRCRRQGVAGEPR